MNHLKKGGNVNCNVLCINDIYHNALQYIAGQNIEIHSGNLPRFFITNVS